jgi:two-component system, sensor histidine kinase and response regulator
MTPSAFKAQIQQRLPSSSLGWRLAGSTFALAVSLSFLASLADYMLSYRVDEAQTREQVSQQVRPLLSSLGLAVWNYDNDALKLVTQELFKLPDLVLVQVMEAGKVLSERGRMPERALSNEFPITYALPSGPAQDVGKLVVVLDFGAVRHRAMGRAVEVFLKSLFIFVLIMGGLLYLMERHVLRYLRQAAHFVEGLTSETLGTALAMERPTPPGTKDELTQLSDGINRMRETLLKSIEQLRADLTLRAQAQAEIEALNHALESRVEERTRELETARRLAEAAAESKSHFLANMSHEIRTPMNAIYGMGHLLQKTPLSSRQQDYVSKMQQAAELLLGIINDILDLSKVESGKLNIEATEFELDQVLRNVVALIGEKAVGKGLELVFSVAPDVPGTLVGDPLRISQILVNFGNNAVKFTDHGVVFLQVSLHSRTEDRVTLRFSVRDTGIGLNEAQQGRLFQSFEQADSSITRKYGGTGLGLAISKRLAELMGGEVGLESREGEGSLFWFTATLGLSDKSKVSALPSVQLRGLKVLVVDDVESARIALADNLERLAFVPTRVGSGAEAIDRVRAADEAGVPFAVVLLDWRMPGLDGLETARILRGLALGRPPVLMLVSAHGRDELQQLALNQGVEHVLAKPVTSSGLLDAMMRALHQPLVPRAAALPSPQVVEHSLPAEAGARFHGYRLLLAEDNPVNQQVATELLRLEGFEVDVACDGEQALDCLARQRYDAVLMDIQMPNMDGVAATLALRRQAHLNDLPVIGLSANVLAEDRRRCLVAGMSDFVAKPIEPQELFAALNQWLPPRPVGQTQPALAATQPAAAAIKEAEGPTPAVNVGPATLVAAEAPGWHVEGLNTQEGLRRMGGRMESYQRLLAAFVKHQGPCVERVGLALEQGQWADARREVHSLKGLAAQIGATRLAQLAQEFELWLHEGVSMSELAPRIAELQACLQARCEAIVRVLPGQIEGGHPGLEQAADLQSLLARLLGMLQSSDAKAARFLTDNAGALQAGLGLRRFERLAKAISDFDYDTALQWLELSSPTTPTSHEP